MRRCINSADRDHRDILVKENGHQRSTTRRTKSLEKEATECLDHQLHNESPLKKEQERGKKNDRGKYKEREIEVR